MGVKGEEFFGPSSRVQQKLRYGRGSLGWQNSPIDITESSSETKKETDSNYCQYLKTLGRSSSLGAEVLSVPPLAFKTPIRRDGVVLKRDKNKDRVEVSSPTLAMTQSGHVYCGVCACGEWSSGWWKGGGEVKFLCWLIIFVAVAFSLCVWLLLGCSMLTVCPHGSMIFWFASYMAVKEILVVLYFSSWWLLQVWFPHFNIIIMWGILKCNWNLMWNEIL